MTLRLESQENRINNNQRMRALFDLRDQVFSPLQKKFYWNLINSFECSKRAVVRVNIKGPNSNDKNIPGEKRPFDMRGHDISEKVKKLFRVGRRFFNEKLSFVVLPSDNNFISLCVYWYDSRHESVPFSLAYYFCYKNIVKKWFRRCQWKDVINTDSVIV